MANAIRISIPRANEDGIQSINEILTVDDLVRACEPIVDRAIAPIEEAITKAGLKARDIDMVILAGGSSQLPKVGEKIEQLLGKRPKKIPRKLMMAVAYGAALYHRDLMNLPQLRSESRILGEDLGMRVQDGGRQTTKLLIPHNAVLPKNESFNFSLSKGQTRATIHLVVLDSMTGNIKSYLKQRDLVLTKNAQSIRVKVDVDENRLIEVTAFDPANPNSQSIIRMDQSVLSAAEAQEQRGRLGITVTAAAESGELQQCVGIDLGTTTSELAFASRSGDDAELETLVNPDQGRSGLLNESCFPSVVYFADGTKDVHVADSSACAMQNDANADGKVFSTFKTQPVDRVLATIDGENLRMQELSAYVLNKIWQTAQEEQEGSLASAVVTVPAAFTVDQCEATYNAAIMAGIPNVTLIDEPTAAFYYYRYVQNINTENVRNVLVFDFGGGTADVAILDISGGSAKQTNAHKDDVFTVRAISGDTNCGGRDVDRALCDEIVHRFETKCETKISASGMSRLHEQIERNKVKLSIAYADSMDE